MDCPAILFTTFCKIATDLCGLPLTEGFAGMTVMSLSIGAKKTGLLTMKFFALYEDYKGRIWCISQTQQLTYIVSDSACSYEHNAILSEVLNQYGVKIPFDRFGVKLTNEDTLTVNVSNLGTLKIAPDGTYEVLIFQLFDTSTLMYPNRKVHMVYDHVNFYLVRGLPKKNRLGGFFIHSKVNL